MDACRGVISRQAIPKTDKVATENPSLGSGSGWFGAAAICETIYGGLALQGKIEKLDLGENHRRVVSAVLRRAESTCEEVLSDLERPSGNLLGFQEDIGPEQAAELRRLVSRLREEIRRIEGEMLLDVSVQSRARCVAGSVSLTRVELEEVLTPGLRGYGILPSEVEVALDEKFLRLLACLETMSVAAERRGSRGAA
jgi:hypothetical protein